MTIEEAIKQGFTNHAYVYGIPAYTTDPAKEPLIIAGKTVLFDYLILAVDRVVDLFYWAIQAQREGIHVLVGPLLKETNHVEP